ncbi:MAG: hypothetical protein R3A80_10360 [Bdellovibrionota bacterium]
MAKYKWHLWGFCFLVILSVVLRYPLWNKLNYADLHWWSADVLNFSGSWFEEGYSYLRGVLYNQPATVEFADTLGRSAFYTFNFAFILPVFWISKLMNEFPNIQMINGFSFLLHVSFAYLAGMLAYNFIKDSKENLRRMAFLMTAFATLFCTQVFLFYSVTYWSDLLVMPLICGIFLIDQYIHVKDKSLKLLYWQQLIVFLACLADPYGIIFSCTLAAYYLVKKDFKRSAYLGVPILIALMIDVNYVSKIGNWALIKGQVLSELGVTLTPDLTLGSFFSGIFVKHLGFYALGFLLSFGIAEALHRRKLFLSKNLILLFVPPILYAFVFANKSLSSSFSALKFYLPVFVCFFGILPAFLFLQSSEMPKKKKREKTLFASLSFLPVVLVATVFAFSYPQLLSENVKDLDMVKRLQWIREITRPEQVIFSNQIALNYYPPQGMYYLRKPIWRFGGATGLKTWKFVFKEAVDYPLLWLEKKSVNSADCIRLYRENAAQDVASYEDIDAYLFPSVSAFLSIPADKIEKCL